MAVRGLGQQRRMKTVECAPSGGWMEGYLVVHGGETVVLLLTCCVPNLPACPVVRWSQNRTHTARHHDQGLPT